MQIVSGEELKKSSRKKISEANLRGITTFRAFSSIKFTHLEGKGKVSLRQWHEHDSSNEIKFGAMSKKKRKLF